MRSATSNHRDTGGHTQPSFSECAKATLRELKREGKPDVLLSHALTKWCDDREQVIVADIAGNQIAVVNYAGQVALIDEAMVGTANNSGDTA